MDWTLWLLGLGIIAIAGGSLGYQVGYRRGCAAPVFRRSVPMPADEEVSGPVVHVADFRRAAESEQARISGNRFPKEGG